MYIQLDEKSNQNSHSKVYVHVGLHRTGTTFLQRVLFPKLRSVNYLNDESSNYWLRRLVSEEDADFAKGRYEDYFHQITQGQPSLISYEGLSGEPFLLYVNQIRNADRMAQLFPDATIILGIRRQDSLLLSLYLLFIMQGGSMSLHQFLGYNKGNFSKRISLYGRRINLEMFELGHIANLYSERFAGRVRFLIYEHMAKDIEGYLNDVCEMLGEPRVPDVSLSVRNQSYGYYQYVLARLINRVSSSFMNPGGLIPALGLPGRTKHPLNHLLRHQTVHNLFNGWPKNRITIPTQLSEEIMEYYSPFNEMLEARWQLGLRPLGYILGETND